MITWRVRLQPHTHIRWRVSLRQDLPNNRVDEWWLASLGIRVTLTRSGAFENKAPFTPQELKNEFAHGNAAGLLYEVVLLPNVDILETTSVTASGAHIIGLRLRLPLVTKIVNEKIWHPREPILVCLDELGVRLISRTTRRDIALINKKQKAR